MDKLIARQSRLQQLHKIQLAGKTIEGRRRIRSYFASFAVKFDAAARTLARNSSDASEDEIAALASSIDPFKKSPHAVRFRRKKKSEGKSGFRNICTLPPAHYAISLMIKDVLEMLLRPSSHLSDLRGRGKDREAHDIKVAIEAGFDQLFVGDIVSCFDSVHPSAYYDLPLPRSVIRYALDHRELEFEQQTERENNRRNPHELSTTSHTDADICPSNRNGPRGLMQGCPASNVILAWLLNDFIAPVPAECRVFLLTDDLLIAAKDEDGCRLIEQTLSARLLAHHAGPFRLLGQFVSAEAGFERAGYEFVASRETGAVRIAPTFSNVWRILNSVEEAIAEEKLARWPSRRGPRLVVTRKLAGFSAATNLPEGFSVTTNLLEFERLLMDAINKAIPFRVPPKPKRRAGLEMPTRPNKAPP